MKFTVASAAAVIAFASSASATPVMARPLMPFSAYASPEGTTAHLAAIQARGQSFYVAFDGKPPSTYCPLRDNRQCPPGESTVISLGQGAKNNDGTTANLSVAVPGGQDLYVRTDGSIGYTLAHSASVPTGALQSGFTYKELSASDQKGQLGFTATDQKVLSPKKWYACPPEGDQPSGAHTKTSYKLYAGIKGWKYETNCEAQAKCIRVTINTAEYKGKMGPTGAWQYT